MKKNAVNKIKELPDPQIQNDAETLSQTEQNITNVGGQQSKTLTTNISSR